MTMHAENEENKKKFNECLSIIKANTENLLILSDIMQAMINHMLSINNFTQCIL